MSKKVNTDAGDDLLKVRRHMQILVDLGLLATQSMALDDFLNHVVSQVAFGLEVSNTKILRYRPETADLLLTHGVGWRKGIVGQVTFGIDLRSAPGRSFQTADPVVVDNVAEPGDIVPSKTLIEHGVVSLLNVPILLQNAAWGVLEVDSVERRDFREDSTDFLLAVSRIVGSVVQRHLAEEAQREAMMRAALEVQERETALLEVQHRVKNYFQMILSMVTIERAKLPDERSRELIGQVAERIVAVSLANDQLSPNPNRQVVAMPTYLRALCANLSSQRENVSISVRADEISLPSERAVPVGLIVNELVANSLKYAFGEGGGGISVELSAPTSGGRALLTVADNGCGIDPSKPPGRGTKLVQSLARQIAGRVEQRSSSDGTVTEITFIDHDTA